jgi:N6-L-threonylcarbamoyladenine synthase
MTKILAIETSCDETAVAVVTKNKEILVNEVISQVSEHKKYGGVVPEIASRAHLNYLDSLLDKVKNHHKINFNDIDAIAVTAGPGLIGGVMVGVMYAKAISASLNKPIIAINHLEGHALTVRLTDNVEYPFLLLLVSGGHTQFLIVKEVGEYIKLGTTLDDALGEAFDKAAKMLGLGYPGGAIIEKKAKKGNPGAFNFPKPLCKVKNCNFSFSGLKTAVKRVIDNIGMDNLTENIICDIAASFQKTIATVLKNKLLNAIEKFQQELSDAPRVFVLSGGVAANIYLREELQNICNNNGFKFYVPPVNLCSDNAAMIAWAAIERYQKGMLNDLSFKPYSKQPYI